MKMNPSLRNLFSATTLLPQASHFPKATCSFVSLLRCLGGAREWLKTGLFLGMQYSQLGAA